VLYPNDGQTHLAEGLREEDDSRNLRDSGTESDRTDTKSCFYPFFIKDGEIIGVGEIPEDSYHPSSANIIKNDLIEVWPISESGEEKKWRYSNTSVHSILDKLEVRKGRTSLQVIFNKDTGVMRSLWSGASYDASEYGTKVLQDILGKRNAALFSYPKSIYTVTELLYAQYNGLKSGITLDYFSGSGTTGHAVINLNREDGGNR